jgi:hypothetical protein
MNFRRIPKFLDVSEGGSTSVAMARLVAVWTLGGVGCCGGLMALMVAAWLQIFLGN